MDENRILHHLNCIKMCQSDKAIIKRIEAIFEEGNSNGWEESSQCPKCLSPLPDIVIYCDKCKESEEVEQ